jgi:hypothetical protein
MSEQNPFHAPEQHYASSETNDGEVMSTPATLGNIFFDPGATFDSLRRKPRFLVAGLILLILSLGMTALLFQRVPYESIVRAKIESSSRGAQMSDEDKEKAIRMQTGPIVKTLSYLGPVIGVPVVFCLGAGLYLLGVMAMGGSMNFKQALSVWVYSSFPPAILASIVGAVVLLFKSSDALDPAHPERNMAQANLGILAGPGTSPALAAVLTSIDVFAIYGLVLAAMGLSKVGKLSSGSAWTVVVGLWILWLVGRVGLAVAFG